MAIKIFIDQGHNPYDINAGAEGFGLKEQEVTYQVGIYLADILNTDTRFETRLSRPSPVISLGTSNPTSLRERVHMANDWSADYFISIHNNESKNPSINGTEIYLFRLNTQVNLLAKNIMNEIIWRVGTKNNGIRINSSLYVLRRTTMPSLLVELAYLTNAPDSQKLRTHPYQFAYAIYRGFLDYLGFNLLLPENII